MTIEQIEGAVRERKKLYNKHATDKAEFNTQMHIEILRLYYLEEINKKQIPDQLVKKGFRKVSEQRIGKIIKKYNIDERA